MAKEAFTKKSLTKKMRNKEKIDCKDVDPEVRRH